ncbi:bifunctional heptose 7-phosphate kinase/heptose 1-phosphate adenyltransferase [Eisenibacter elegans]|jgi:rfaE bifunctional protein kinase chain/domain|uniref:bifunctional heptose 7-phosphate kinase/heptose 1-phosphate adenyltransferase n=1 Tax=Eisenibacter elegans TaxID=997 RepID=UPI0003FCFBF9|nr:bifunctional ADP-heptose synthase [Eisenibacter elegans]
MKTNTLTIQDTFEAFGHQQALIIGDVMIDSYLWGKVERISPEAPVPVVQVQKREKRLGGAANVALNMQALGAKPMLCAVIGDDSDGQDLIGLLHQHGLSSEGIVQATQRLTTIKHRIISGHQHMLRVDSETTQPINATQEEQLLARIASLLPQTQVVVFEDYDKGCITPSLIASVIRLAQEYGIPTVVDPKKLNFLHYHGATLFKPNFKELKEGLKIDIDIQDKNSICKAAAQLRDKLSLHYAFITLSEHGVYIGQTEEDVWIPAHKRSIADVSGAGDTVISVAALCLALGLSAARIAALSNLAGGLVCESVGVVSIDKERLLAEAIKHQLFEQYS